MDIFSRIVLINLHLLKRLRSFCTLNQEHPWWIWYYLPRRSYWFVITFFVLLWVNFTNTQVLCMYEAGFAKVKTVVCFAPQFSSFSTRLKQKSWYYKKILSKTCFPSFFFRSFIMGLYNFWRIIIVFTTSYIIFMKNLKIDYLMMQMNRNN